MRRLALRKKPHPTCGTCHTAPARRQGAYCAECHSAYMRRWRANRTMEFKALKARVAALEQAATA
jgi:hypothetical protein